MNLYKMNCIHENETKIKYVKEENLLSFQESKEGNGKIVVCLRDFYKGKTKYYYLLTENTLQEILDKKEMTIDFRKKR